jgi:hypothetical protein
MNAARQGSRRTTKCEEFQVVAAHLYIDAAANRSRVLSPWARARRRSVASKIEAPTGFYFR